MTQQEAKVIIALAANGLKIEPATRMLYMHRSTLCRHIRRIKQRTALDPQNFYDMEWLVPKAKATLGHYGRFYENGGMNCDKN